ncbi:MAG: hypothetical protein PUB52_02070 [Lachnospiraceae bacterium]|nr:hypothetical protein [Lachnospiraceae bacterium]
MSDESYRLMGQLYHLGFKKYRLIKTTNDYFDLVMGVPCTSPTQSDIFQYDFYSKNALSDFKERLISQDEFIRNLEKYVGDMNSTDKIEFNSVLANIVSSVTDYSECGSRSSNFDSNSFKSYETNELLRLKSYYSAKKDNFNLAYNVFLLIYLSVYKRLPVNFFFGTTYEKDLNEFNVEVTCKYGVTSKPGIRAIISLAERNDQNGANIFALYEYADMLYYGTKNGPGKNINAAFKTYKLISNTNDNSPCHPLAQWTLAYIFYNYHQPRTELENCDTIPEIEQLDRLDQLKEAIRYAKYAYDLVNNPAAANILGKICMISDKEVPGIESLKVEAGLKEAKKYFQDAADQEYVYAYANLANIYLEEIFDDPSNQIQHLDDYLLTLKKQADQYEPWAANKLGLFYLNGEVESRKTGNKLLFIEPPYDYRDRTRSFLFFSQATSHFNDMNSGWAYANMIINFPKKYIGDEGLTTLKQHLEKLKSIGNAGAIQYVNKNFFDTYNPYESIESCKSLLSIIQL